MPQYLPVDGFSWLAKYEINEFHVSKIRVDCILEVELHDIQNDYPLAPEKTEIKESMMPDYCRELSK